MAPSNPKPAPSCTECQSRSMGVLCNLDSEALEKLNSHKTSNRYLKGQIIFYEGNQAFGLYGVYSGRVKLYKTGIDGRRQIVRICGPGDILGYRSLFAEEPYHATAEALEDSTICCIDRAAFFSVIGENPRFAFDLLRKLSVELRSAEDLATSIAQRPVRQRMAELLVMLQQTYGKPVKKGVQIHLELSREEMAEMIGVTQETAIRLLSEFKKGGWISVQERCITILNPQSLLEVAEIE
ncbi:Crp/Fnr family transcriptional regulator [bacterium]|nr:MAG: Crp/Fnr family transcriptional regulator [bacterium]